MPQTRTRSSPDAVNTGGRGVQHQSLRRANERAVMTAIGFNPGLSNADIARLSALAPQTVSAILLDMERAGLIMRGAVLRGRRGQPATPIYPRAEGGFSIGVEIGWKHIDVLLLDMHAQVLTRQHRRHAYPDAGRVVDDIVEMLGAVTPHLGAALRPRLRDIGVALPSNIGAVLHLTLPEAPPEQAQLWSALDLAGKLRDVTGLDATLFNDGNAACWSELIACPRPRPPGFIYFFISCYIAAGIVGEGTLREGPNGNSANLGSMLVGVGEDGTLLPAHDIASLTALERRLARAGIAHEPCAPQQWDWAGFGPVLDAWIADSAAALARVAYSTSTVIETGLVVIDGLLPAPILARLIAQIQVELERLPVTGQALPHLRAGHSGAQAPAIGAAELVLYRRHFLRESGSGG
ncbi:MAG: hypothetical protein ABS76_11680 [Pelagibacterium sp. SCN 64-44]|nr:MAG: hypothetical protein ABS76_11680 [Pelagibacterium sp. SCN 64-44]